MAVLEPGVYGGASLPLSSNSNSTAGTCSTAVLAELGPVTAADIAAALVVTKPSAQMYEARYQEFSAMYGQVL